MKPKQFYYVWASPTLSAWEISEELTALNVSHTIRVRSSFRAINLRQAQPKPVHITTELRNLKAGGVTFITASYAALSLTNYPVMKGSVRDALLSRTTTEPTYKIMSPMDYVNAIAKPSSLNKIQTLVYRIQPYSLRKETQKLVIDYFNGKVSYRKASAFLGRSYKTTNILPLLAESDVLKKAIEQYPAKTAEALEEEFGVPAFEIRYIAKERQ